MNKQRLEAFTDAILAIIMTIMVLELHAPSGFTLVALKPLVIPLIAYVISFIGLSNLWVTHHSLFEQLHHVSYGVFVANMFLVLWVSFLPLATSWIAAHPTHSIPQVTFMIVQLGWTLLLLNLQRMCKRADATYPAYVIEPLGIKVTIGIQVAGGILSVFLPYVALIAGSLIIVLYLLWPIHGVWLNQQPKQ